MADITEDRVSAERCIKRFADPLADGALIPAGAMYVLDGDGNAIPATASGSGPVRGIAMRRADAAAGATRVEGASGCWLFQNSATDPIGPQHVGKSNAKVEDCHTVSVGGSATVGKVIEVTDEGVFVQLGDKW